ncbi:hypothetical protein OWR29_37585 [Actinoplanes sp. Pm04-4]|uniref:Uncharacterized protein n=1 Tax=Paractinoplanes pyxinae TaxID=2997416 RepID=A0ABT4BB95_9ACTN|nr:hypothetical protein [Actinoplanes pyxinae]MCY1143746.1 hypothetical protein [Actinoplanes pyxinae]
MDQRPGIDYLQTEVSSIEILCVDQKRSDARGTEEVDAGKVDHDVAGCAGRGVGEQMCEMIGGVDVDVTVQTQQDGRPLRDEVALQE